MKVPLDIVQDTLRNFYSKVLDDDHGIGEDAYILLETLVTQLDVTDVRERWPIEAVDGRVFTFNRLG